MMVGYNHESILISAVFDHTPNGKLMALKVNKRENGDKNTAFHAKTTRKLNSEGLRCQIR